jgi:subtilase family serine protease
MLKKEYKIVEIVDMIGASKATIYNKLNILKTSLKNHVNTRKGITYIDEEGIEIIKKSIGLTKEKFQEQMNPRKKTNSTESKHNQEYIESLKNQIETLKYDNEFLSNFLKQTITEKDKQLNSKDEIIKNFQVLLKNEQENNIKLLERKNESIFQKLFRRKK